MNRRAFLAAITGGILGTPLAPGRGAFAYGVVSFCQS